MKECPQCKKMTLKIFYDDERNGGLDYYECHNENCNWRG